MKKTINKYHFRPTLPIKFEIVRLSELYTKEKKILTTPHRTNFYHVLWFREGSISHQIDFENVKIEENTLLFINKDVVHCFDDKVKFEGIGILFTDTFFCQTEADTNFLTNTILFNDLFSVSYCLVNNENTIINELMTLIQLEFQKANDSFRPKILKNYLYNFLLLAERERRKQGFIEVKKGADLNYTLLFKDLLADKYKSEKNVSAYANELRITEKRLNQATSKVLGKSPKKMIIERILLEAKRLLSYTSLTVKEISFMLGFEEPTNFIKFFRKHSLQTPSEFRKKYLLA